MFMYSILHSTIILIACVFHSMQALPTDNRFLPFLPHPPLQPDDTTSYVTGDIKFASASTAYGTGDNEIGIPEIYGLFDEGILGRAMKLTTGTNPLRSYFQDKSIRWRVNGRLQMQGFVINAYHQCTDIFGIGGSLLFMNVKGRQEFLLDDLIFITSDGIRTELEDARRHMFSLLGMNTNYTSRSGVSDLDLFISLSYLWEYTLKFRRIHPSLKLGVLFPTGKKQDNFIPASIPFGGDGLWGIYGQADVLFQLKEDFSIGLLFRTTKRLPKTQQHRVSILGEPYIFGALVAPVRVSPGFTINLSPYLLLEHLREGFGLGVYYTLTLHTKDRWHDQRADKTIPIDFKAIETTTRWNSDYISLHAFYDFGARYPWSGNPIINVKWDIPASIIVNKRTAKTHLVSVGIEYAY